MSNQPQVSIIVPCYNQGRFLSETLDSVRAQTYRDWECIVVNDGSTDNTKDVAQRYANEDSRIRYLEPCHQGVGAARNYGLRESRGRYIQFLDADDLLIAEKIQKQLHALAGETKACVAYCDYYITDANDFRTGSINSFSEPRFIMNEPLLDIAARWESDLSIPIHCFLFDARFFSELGCTFDERLPTHEDWDCWMQIFRLNPTVKHVRQKLAVYRNHSESMCRDQAAMWRGFSDAIDKQTKLFRGKRNIQKLMHRNRKRIGRMYCQQTERTALAAFASWTRVLVRHIPWPVQKVISSFVEMD